MTRYDRFLQLETWGFNIPSFVQNPHGAFKRDTYSYLQEFFGKNEKVSVLAKHRELGKEAEFNSLWLRDAALRTGFLELDYDVIVFEEVEVEFAGEARFYKEGKSSLRRSDIKETLNFYSVERVEDLKVRHILRELSKIAYKVGENVLIFFRWAKDFRGVNASKLIIYDFLLL